jgi:predicted metal-dependent hydrolase
LTTVEQSISRIICKISQYHAPKLVLEIAEDESKRLGIYPAHYVISSGARTLGRCSTRKIISLSSRLAFLPEELRRYVICHELAHLKEMNHSPRFHALVNEYTNGREEELEQKLRKFEWPIIR